MRTQLLWLCVAFVVLAIGLPAQADVFNNPNYTYTLIWDGGADGQARWPSYHADTGKLTWRGDGTGNAYIADFDASTGSLTNVTQIATGGVYGAQFTPAGDYITWLDWSESTTLTFDDNTSIGCNTVKRYNVATGTTETVFDISTLDPAKVAALTDSRHGDALFYANPYGSSDEIVISLRAHANDRWDLYSYTAGTDTLTRLTTTDHPSEYNPYVFGTDQTKILTWTEMQNTGGQPRDVQIYDTTTGSYDVVFAGTAAGDTPRLDALSNAWGKDQEHVVAAVTDGSNGYWTSTDLWLYEKQGDDWVKVEDLTGTAHSESDLGMLYPGTTLEDGSFLFGSRFLEGSSNGLWYAQAIPEPASFAIWGLLAIIGMTVTRRRR